MIVLKAPQDQVRAALQAVSGIVEKRHVLPVLANERRRTSDAFSLYEEYIRLRQAHEPALMRLLAPLPPLISEFVRPPIKLALRLPLGRMRELRGFFGATKVNARNAP